MSTYAIGDIQGCFDTLQRLLATLQFDPAVDQLWLVGDLVNRGPNSLEVLRWARNLGDSCIAVLGNHDLHLIARAAGAAPPKKRDTLSEILAADDRDELIFWLRTRPFLHCCGDDVMVHAGIHPQWTVRDAKQYAAELQQVLSGPSWQLVIAGLGGKALPWRDSLNGMERWRTIASVFARIRTCSADGVLCEKFKKHPKKAPEGCIPWFSQTEESWREHRIVFGHWSTLGVQVTPRYVALDSGCVWGKSLTAIRLEDGAVVSVDAVDDET